MIYRTGFVDIYKKWLLFLILLFLFAPNTIALINKVIFIILVFFLFITLIPMTDKYLPSSTYKFIYNSNLYFLILLIVLQFILADYVSRYYTGSSSIESIYNLISGESNYSKYQEYFKNQQLATFTITKIPAILSNAIVKGTFLFCIASLTLSTNATSKYKILFISAIPLILFAISRGTFFEFFEVFLCIIYFYKLREKNIGSSFSFDKVRKNFKIILVSSFLLFLFVYNAGERYGGTESLYTATCATDNLCFEPYTNLYSLEYPLYFLSTYFSAGFFFFTEYIKLILDGELLNSLIPFVSSSYFSSNGNSLFQELCYNYIDCGTSWTPELFSWISIFGIVVFFLVFPVIFYIFFKFEKIILGQLNIYALPLCYFILLYLISIPVGSFYSVSSSNIICSIVFFFLWKFTKKIKVNNS